MTKEELLNMKLHEEVKIKTRFCVTRVLGGWIYCVIRDTMTSSCFVPEEININAKIHQH